VGENTLFEQPGAVSGDKTLQPLAKNAMLRNAAEDHIQDMLTQYYYDTVSPDGLTVADRVMAAGYSPVDVDEILGWVAVDAAETPEELVSRLFDRLVAEAAGDGGLLQPDMMEIGVALALAIQRPADAPPCVVLVAVIDVGRQPLGAQRYATGIVYADRNGSGAYDPGEERGGERVIIYGAGLHLDTDECGGYTALLSPKVYLAIWFSPDHFLTREVAVAETNTWSVFVSR
jgi:hypothetical protein